MSLNSDDTDLLIEEMRSGNREEGARKLFEKYRSNVEGYFTGKGVPREEARELTQDVFFRVFKSIDSLRGASEFKAWLFQIAQNAFKNWLRSKKAEKRNASVQSLDSPPGDEGALLDPPAPSEDTDSLEILITQELREELLRALDELPERMRRCCWMRYVQGMKYQEIADELKISIETVKAHLFQGRKRLLAALRGQGPKR
ncbi:MAG TPA: sigma-70 family RNA polymerase sigma factor [Thermoanaerobaculia bacterium]|nr:sigma-70 family RNA polymerase sigma factor [Thermoanaerobaculia bacterium]